MLERVLVDAAPVEEDADVVVAPRGELGHLPRELGGQQPERRRARVGLLGRLPPVRGDDDGGGEYRLHVRWLDVGHDRRKAIEETLHTLGRHERRRRVALERLAARKRAHARVLPARPLEHLATAALDGLALVARMAQQPARRQQRNVAATQHLHQRRRIQKGLRREHAPLLACPQHGALVRKAARGRCLLDASVEVDKLLVVDRTALVPIGLAEFGLEVCLLRRPRVAERHAVLAHHHKELRLFEAVRVIDVVPAGGEEGGWAGEWAGGKVGSLARAGWSDGAGTCDPGVPHSHATRVTDAANSHATLAARRTARALASCSCARAHVVKAARATFSASSLRMTSA